VSSQIVLVADNRSLSLGLTGQDYDIVDLRPDEVDDWLKAPEPVDLLVVGVERPAEALDVVAAFRDVSSGIPVLLVASNAPGWSSLGQAGDLSVEILSLPVTRVSLVAAVHRVLESASVTNAPTLTVAPETTPVEPRAVEGLPEEAAAAELYTVEPLPVEPPPPIPAPVLGHLHHPLEADPPAPHDAGAVHQRVVAVRSTEGLRERLAQSPVATNHDSAAQVAEWSQLVHPAEQAAPVTATPAEVTSPRRLVDGLLARLDDLVDTRDAAGALADEAAGLADASSAAVLLPDSGVWKVCGAYGVRPLEWRYIVEADSWLTATVIIGKRGVIVEESDIARQRLGGAPLAHHRHLMAAPIPAAEGLLILARDDAAFDETQLSAVATACVNAGVVLADALEVRRLARGLSDFRGDES
jgi:hypothetical protein